MDGDDDSMDASMLLAGDGGGGGSVPPRRVAVSVPPLSPNTQAQYQRIDEEFDHVLHTEVMNIAIVHVHVKIIIYFLITSQ